MRIDERVHLVGSGTFGISHPGDANLYAVDCGSSTVLVDAGCGLDSASILTNLSRTGLPDVSHILLTHSHWDHARGVADIAASTGAQVWAHESARAELTEHLWRDHYVSRSGGVRAKPREADTYITTDEVVTVGDLDVRVLPTPGHSPDSVSYSFSVEDASYLFTGDTVLGEGQLGTSDANTDFRALRDSVRRLAGLRPLGLFPGHHAFCLRYGYLQLDVVVELLESKWATITPGRLPFMPTWWIQRLPELIEKR